MEKITVEEFLKKASAGAALPAGLDADADPAAALETLSRLAAEKGYELVLPAPAAMEPLSDDELAPVSGGLTTVLPRRDGELNPYSWFVTLMRRLTGMEDPRPEVPEIPGPGSSDT